MITPPPVSFSATVYLLFKIYVFVIYVYVCLCQSVCNMYAVPLETRRGCQTSWDRCLEAVPHGYLELNLEPLEE